MEMAAQLKNLFGRAKTAVGIDVGQRNVKCVQLRKRKNAIHLENIFMVDLADGNPDFPTNTHLREKLSAAVEVNRMTDLHVLSAGSSGQVQMLDLQLNAMPKKEMEIVIAKNLQGNLNVAPSELTFDYKVFGDGANRTVRVFYALKQETLKIVDALTSSELQPVQLNAGFLAMTEMLIFNEYIEPDKAYIVVDLGETATCTSLIVNQEVKTSHSHSVGFGIINQKLTEKIACSYADAEQTKQFLLNLEQIGNAQAEEIVDQCYVSLMETLQSSIDFYKDQESTVRVSEILLTGGPCVYGSLVQSLEDYYQLPTKIINPFRNIQTVSDSPEAMTPEMIKGLAPFMSNAVGLALGGLDW